MIEPDDIQVVIPSRRRVESCKRAIRLWPKCVVTVDESEADDYKDVGVPIVTHPPVNGLGQLRQWILDNFSTRVIIQCNDDVSAIRTTVGRTRKITDPAAIFQIMLNSANAAEVVGASVFCFSPTAVAFRIDPFKPFTFQRIEGALFGMIDRRLRFDPRIAQHDDVDLSLTALLKDRIVWQDNRFAPEHNFMTKGGGNSVNRGQERMEAELAYMREKWGGYFGKLVRKPSTKGKIASGVPLTSLTISVPRQQDLEIDHYKTSLKNT